MSFVGALLPVRVLDPTSPSARSVVAPEDGPKLIKAPVLAVPAPMRMRWWLLNPPSVVEVRWYKYQPTMLKLPDPGAALSSVHPIGEFPRLTFKGVLGSESKFWE